jgi:hypothetical protein
MLFGQFDISILRALFASTKEYHNHRPNLAEIDPIPRTIIDSQFLNTFSDPVAISKVSKTNSVKPDPNLGADSGISQ